MCKYINYQQDSLSSKNLATIKNQIDSKQNPIIERYALRIATSPILSVKITDVRSKDGSWLPE